MKKIKKMLLIITLIIFSIWLNDLLYVEYLTFKFADDFYTTINEEVDVEGRGYYKILNDVNCPYRRLCLHGLDEKMEYTIEGVDGVNSGRELMKAGMITSDPSAGQVLDGGETCTDFWSKIYLLHGEK